MRGWFPVHRKVFRDGHWLSPTAKRPASNLHAWLDLCQLAQHAEYEHVETLRRGEFMVSIRWLASRWKWHRSSIERFLNRAETETMIETVRETPRGTIYRIVKYDTYAIAPEPERDTYRDTERDTSETLARQEQELTTNNTPPNPPSDLLVLKREGETLYAIGKAYCLAVDAGLTPADILKARQRACAATERRYWKSLTKWLEEIAKGGLPPEPDEGPSYDEQRKARREWQKARDAEIRAEIEAGR